MSFRRPPRDIDRMTSLRVGNLPFSATAEDMTPLFEKFGDIGDIYFPLERGSGRSRGFAFVRYYDKRDAEDAMDSLNGRTYDGRDLRISLDPGRPARDDYGGGRRRYSRSRSRSRGRGRRSRSRSRGGRRSRSRSRDRRSRSRSRGGRRSRSRSRDRRSRSRSKSRSRDRKRSASRDRSGSRGRSKSRSRSNSR
eukprot:TRINITY_DN10385_c0_g1_i1.p1 TRINITY_DN10385_c0_g1~~TRINITY_DN10385_c0_g1_i1.p1  ORF type:complete len:194 (-),score=16.16 TRINITY_DN10385_c0_g1_i1:536-1117(-)